MRMMGEKMKKEYRKPSSNKCPCGCGNNKTYHFNKIMKDFPLQKLLPQIKQTRLWEVAQTNEFFIGRPNALIELVIECGIRVMEEESIPKKCPLFHRGCKKYAKCN